VIAVRSPGDVAAVAAAAVGVAVAVLANDNNTSRSPNWFVRISF